MKQQYSAKMVRIYFIESDEINDRPLYEEIVNQCWQLGLETVIVYKGIGGFGASARIFHARTLSISKNAPVMVSVLDREEKIQKLLPQLDEIISGGLVAISSVEVIRYSKSAALVE